MSIWERLGLDGPTRDIKAIKRAYSKAVKHTRPEEDPEGFMALRKAYDAAQRYAKTPSRAVKVKVTAAEDLPIKAKALDARAENNDVPKKLDVAAAKLSAGVPVSKLDKKIVKSVEIAEPSLENTTSNNMGNLDPDHIFKLRRKITALIKNPNERKDNLKWVSLIDEIKQLPINEYGLIEDYLLAQLMAVYRDVKKKAQRRLPFKTVSTIFSQMQWTNSDARPRGMQEDLLWLSYETDLVERPSDNNLNENFLSFWKERMKWVAVLIFFISVGFLGEYGTKPKISPHLNFLPAKGESVYGSYKKTESDQFTYSLKRHPDVTALQGDQTLKDNFKLQLSSHTIVSIDAIIRSEGVEPKVIFNQNKIFIPKNWQEKANYFFESMVFYAVHALKVLLICWVLLSLIEFRREIWSYLKRQVRRRLN